MAGHGTMKAVRIHEYGGPGVLRHEDAPRPEPGEGEALIRVYAAGVNPIDWKVRSGMLQKYIPYELPLIVGWDVCGTVEALGPKAVAPPAAEDVYTRADTRRNGSYAQYMTVNAADLALRPPSLDRVQAAAVPLAGLTAFQALFEPNMIDLLAGQTVLIHGAAGGVGSYAVQLAAWKGAEVIVTGAGWNSTFLRDLGADRFIDYTTEKFEEVAHGLDAVLDLVGGDTQRRSLAVLKPGGVLASTVGISVDAEAKEQGIRTAAVSATTKVDQLDAIGKLIEEGFVKPVISEVFPLSDARKAHELSEAGHVRGKIVLRVD